MRQIKYLFASFALVLFLISCKHSPAQQDSMSSQQKIEYFSESVKGIEKKYNMRFNDFHTKSHALLNSKLSELSLDSINFFLATLEEYAKNMPEPVFNQNPEIEGSIIIRNYDPELCEPIKIQFRKIPMDSTHARIKLIEAYPDCFSENTKILHYKDAGIPYKKD